MKINAIIAEYNPFHKGHLYHMEQSKKLTGADYTVAVMSGNFVQRGAPALTDKFTRAEMALRSGIDLVLELPSFYSMGGAEDFAMGSISILNQLDLVDTLCFGSESGDLEMLKVCASSYLEESQAYNTLLQSFLKEGNSYAKASELALSRLFDADSPIQKENANDRLAIEYLKALQRTESTITPFTIKREGGGYHDSALDTVFSSASALREELHKGISPSQLESHLPSSTVSCLEQYLQNHPFLDTADCSVPLLYKLHSLKDKGYDSFVDVNTDLSNKIGNLLYDYTDFDQFCHLIKSKNITYARISRALMHILTGYTKENRDYNIKVLKYTPYVKVLGVRKDAMALLSALSKASSIPLITQLSEADKVLNGDFLEMLRQDTNISEIYSLLQACITHTPVKNEYRHKFLIV